MNLSSFSTPTIECRALRVLPQMVFIDGELVFSSRPGHGTLGGLILEGQGFEDRDAEFRSRHPFR